MVINMAKDKKQKNLTLEIISSVPGRLRVKFPRETETPEVERYLEIAEEIEEVSFNPLTNSLIIHYDENFPSEGIIKLFRQSFPHVSFVEIDSNGRGSQTNVVSNVVQNFFRKTNKKVQKRTSGFADLTSLVPMAFMMTGAARFFTAPLFPNWYDFIWYGYNMVIHFKQVELEEKIEKSGEKLEKIIEIEKGKTENEKPVRTRAKKSR